MKNAKRKMQNEERPLTPAPSPEYRGEGEKRGRRVDSIYSSFVGLTHSSQSLAKFITCWRVSLLALRW